MLLLDRLRDCLPAATALPSSQKTHWPLATCQTEPPGRIGIALHVFYPELLAEFGDYLSRMPWPFDLLVSVTREEDAPTVEQELKTLPMLETLVIRRVPNRGRDLAPLLITYNEELRKYDFIGHFHTKKTPQAAWGGHWREHLLSHLLSETSRLQQIFFHLAHSGVGMVYPPLTQHTPFWAMSWLSNGEIAQPLCERLGIRFDAGAYFSFPVGSMFWARREALLPLLDLHLASADFPNEEGQRDGTLQHAIERLLGLACRQAGWPTAIIDLAHECLEGQDSLNASRYLDAPIGDTLLSVLPHFEALTLSTQTLVTSPFTDRSMMLRFIAECDGEAIGLRRNEIDGFLAFRDKAGQSALSEASPTLREIGEALQRLGVGGEQAEAWVALEADTELRLWQPRQAMLSALEVASESMQGMGAVVDLPLPSTSVLARLQALGFDMLDTAIGSDDARTRLRTLAFWEWVVEHAPALKDRKVLHVGEDPYRDMQLPWQMDERVTPLHVMPGTAMLSLAWPYREWSARLSCAAWQDDLWKGLLARRLVARVDREPGSLSLDTRRISLVDIGYLFIGPLLLDMLARWLRWAEKYAFRHLFLPVDNTHVVAKMYTRLLDVTVADDDRTCRRLPRLHCRPHGKLPRWMMKFIHPAWQREWFWSDFSLHSETVEGSLQFMEDLLFVVGRRWRCFYVNDEALMSLNGLLRVDGRVPAPQEVTADAYEDGSHG